MHWALCDQLQLAAAIKPDWLIWDFPVEACKDGSEDWLQIQEAHMTAKKDLLFWQLFISPELQLLTWFYGMLLEQSIVTASYGQYSAHGVATGTTECY